MNAAIPFAGCFGADPAETPLVFAGLPDDSRSSFERGTALAPRCIREAYDGRGHSATSESGHDLAGRIADLGDWSPGESWSTTRSDWTARTETLLRDGKVPFFAGGDHAVTIPILAAYRALGRPVHVVQIDAHPDLYPEYDGDPDSHACIAARALDMTHVASLTQYGIRTLNAVQRETASRHRDRLHIHHARDLTGSLPPPALDADDALYITVDMDGLDPAFAPGVSHAVPGGLTSRQVLNLLHDLPGQLVGMDVVEVNPRLDEGNRTAILAGRLLHEGMAKAARR